MSWLRLFCVLALSGCVDYAHAPAGEFQGEVIVMWVDETEGRLGDGKFVFVPSETPLVFKRDNPDASVTTIEPGMMYTDGGSIPALAQGLKGFSPWGYAPAYMVHDWLFVARKCKNDGMADAEQEALVGKMSFHESAEIAAEAIKTLVESGRVARNDVAGSAISWAVAGPVARGLWNDRGACVDNQIKPEHLEQIYRALPGLRPPGEAKAFRRLDAGPKAQIIQTVRF